MILQSDRRRDCYQWRRIFEWGKNLESTISFTTGYLGKRGMKRGDGVVPNTTGQDRNLEIDQSIWIVECG